jgi:hypothetical protein
VPFFEPPPPKRRRRSRVPVEDESWTRPSLYLPGRIPNDIVIASAEDHAVIVGGIACYATGFGFNLRTAGRYYYDDDVDDPVESAVAMSRRPRDGQLSPTLLRFGVEYSDGGKATTLDPHWFSRQYDGPGPHMYMGGGGGGGNSWSWEIWVTPLPPEGPVAFVCEWPAFGIQETRRSIPGARIRKAAERARRIF